MRVATYSFLAAVIGTPSIAKAENVEMQLSAIAATLKNESLNMKTNDVRPCVKPDVKASTDVRHQEVTLRIPSRILPAGFRICSGRTLKSYYQLYQPDLYGQKAAVSIEMQCGDLCGLGKTVFLRRTKGGWKFVEERQSWVS